MGALYSLYVAPPRGRLSARSRFGEAVKAALESRLVEESYAIFSGDLSARPVDLWLDHAPPAFQGSDLGTLVDHLASVGDSMKNTLSKKWGSVFR